jgi:hypothetical protein
MINKLVYTNIHHSDRFQQLDAVKKKLRFHGNENGADLIEQQQS